MNTELELAWAAGFFDGEGYITIQVRGGKYKGHYLRVGVNHVAPEPLYMMADLFGGSVRLDASSGKGNRKKRHVWSISCTKAATALYQMLPYLRNKDDVTKLALQFQDTMGTTEKVPDNVVEYRQHLKEKIQKANACD